MTYEEAVAAAPPGWEMFALEDVDRLPRAIRIRALKAVPSNEMETSRAGDPDASERIRRSLFWTFLYQLRPELWDALAAAEPIHPKALRLLRDLGGDRGRVLEIGPGSGRLTIHLSESCERLLAIDASIPLLRIVRSRVASAGLAAGLAEALPVRDGWADAVVSCASLPMDDAVIAEAERVIRPDGLIVLINPEPGDRRGWASERFDPEEVALPARDPWIDRVFGTPHPPSEVVWRMGMEPAQHKT